MKGRRAEGIADVMLMLCYNKQSNYIKTKLAKIMLKQKTICKIKKKAVIL